MRDLTYSCHGQISTDSPHWYECSMHRHADSIFKSNFIYFYFWLCRVLVAAGLSLAEANVGFSLVTVHGLLVAVTSLAVEQGSRCSGFSRCASHALELRLCSCGAWA